MTRHLRFGQQGEQLAAQYLIESGFTVLHRNWRHGRYEIDIIALRGQRLHIIEVKTRSTAAVYPEEAVTRKKFGHLLQAADEFLYRHPEYRHVQYDILSIRLLRGNPEFLLLEDVYL
ncbi:MAG TPA: YraN family protein [Chitinophagaceae bacterium]|jgi:putative endonuclease|nr:YraN family protein [Chitinophagaceae bacterium]